MMSLEYQFDRRRDGFLCALSLVLAVPRMASSLRRAAGAPLLRRLGAARPVAGPATSSGPWLLTSRRHGAAADAIADVSLNREWTPASVRCGALGMKCGMTQTWTRWGERMPLTVVEIQDLQVTKVKTGDKDGLAALQLGGGWQKRKRLSKVLAGQFVSRELPLKGYLREFRVSEDALLPLGTSITARHFMAGQYVDVQGVTKGKGFQGVMKRWGFAGQEASHGNTKAHRKAGSSGGSAGSMYATRVKPGKKMAGRMGNKRQTMQSLLVYRVVPQHNLLLLKGSVPGGRGGILRIRDTLRHKHKLRAPPPFPTFLPGDAAEDDAASLVFEPAAKDPLSLS